MLIPRTKKGQIGGFTTLFLAMVVVFLILLIFIFSFSLVKTFNEVEYGTETIRISLIGSYMEGYEKKFSGVFACEVDSSNKVINAPCSCSFSGDELEVCSDGEYCYEDARGCDDK